MNATRFTSIPRHYAEHVAQRIAANSDTPNADGCIEWRGRCDRYGYPKFVVTFDGRKWFTSAHRVAWVSARGEIEDSSLIVDHLCRNRRCVNADHLELVTAKENVMRGAVPLMNRAKLGLPAHRTNTSSCDSQMVCRRGHEMTSENTYTRTTKEGYIARSCKTCAAIRLKSWKQRQIAAA